MSYHLACPPLMPRLIPGAAAILLLCVAQAVAADAPSIERKQSELTGVQELQLTLHHGQVTVSTASATPGQVTVELEQRLKRGDPERCLYQLKEARRGSHASFSAKAASDSGWRQCSVERHYRIELDPASLKQLSLAHHHSRITLDQLTVPHASLDFQHSRVTLGPVSGDRIDLTLAHALAQVDSLQAGSIELNGQHSNLRASTLVGQTGRGHWQHGKLEVGESRIENLRLTNEHSTTEFNGHQGTQLEAKSSHGPLRIAGNLSQSAELRTSHSRLVYEGAVPRLKVNSEHGSSRLIQTLATAPFQIDGVGSHGSIDVIVPAGVQYQYEVNSNRGRSAAGQVGTDSELSRISLNVSHGKARINPR